MSSGALPLLEMTVEQLERLLCLLEVRLNAVGLCQVGKGWRLRLPAKQDVLIHYVLSGDALLRTSDGTSLELETGALVFIPPGMTQELSDSSDGSKLMDWKDAAQGFGEGMMKVSAGAGEPAVVSACGLMSADCAGLPLFDNLRVPVQVNVARNAEVRFAFELMLREFQSPRFGTRALGEALMKQILILTLRKRIEQEDLGLLPFGVLPDPRLARAILRMVEEPSAEHGVGELASISGMSRSLFAERFTQAFGRAPIDLLKQIRLHRAASLLNETELPVQIIGKMVGYSSRTYFSRAFRAAYGRDPRTFRRQARSPALQDKERQNAST